MKNLMIILIGSIFAGIIAQIAVNITGYNSKGIAMLIFLTVLGISLITTAGSKNKKVNRGIIMEKYSKERLEKALKYWEEQLQIINEYKLNKDNCWHYQFQGPLSKTDVKFFEKRRHKIYKKCKAYCENKIEIIKEMKGKKR